MGGSIDKGYSTLESDFEVQDPQIEKILAEANMVFCYTIESLLKKDSLEVTDEDRHLLLTRVKNEPCQKILITHGTDTMAETGKVLSAIPDKTIVLTGAMQPASFKITDASFNIGFALAAVQLLSSGVYIAMNGQLFDPHQVTKNMELDRFEPK